jgi:phage baseplate assembly protein W
MTATLNKVRNTLVGYGLIAPLRRHAGKDFSTGGGDALIKSQVAQVLNTRIGEVPWKPTFGVNLDQYRHRAGAEGLADVIADTVTDALQEWIEVISVTSALVEMGQGLIKIKVMWRVMSQTTPSNAVLVGPNVTEVEV